MDMKLIMFACEATDYTCKKRRTSHIQTHNKNNTTQHIHTHNKNNTTQHTIRQEQHRFRL